MTRTITRKVARERREKARATVAPAQRDYGEPRRKRVWQRNENSPSRLAADGVSNSFAIWTEIAYALLEVHTNVPGGAVPPLASLLRVDRALRAR